MDKKTDLPELSETVVPISKTVAGTFAKAQRIVYANHENGSLYISNGIYILKASQEEFYGLLEQVNRRQRKDKIPVTERPDILKYVDSGRGKFELSQEPLEFETDSNRFISLFADEKQYFGYEKKYVDIFNNGDNRLFVDDNEGYDPNSHHMIIKSRDGEILGVVLPIRLSDEFYANMADVLPLKNGWKTELERIKENPTNDLYIGKEYFDGLDTHIISAVTKIKDVDMYVVPRVENGKPTRSADYVKTDEIENQIAQWETKRIDRENEKRKLPPENKNPPAQEENKPRPFTHIKKSLWGDVTASEKLCPGVFMVSAGKQGGIMVASNMTAAFSPAALKCGSKYNGYVCFEDNGVKEVALRELLDKKLWVVPADVKDKAAYEEKINQSLRERQPQYWRSRENGRVNKLIDKSAPAKTNKDR